ncbi:MAG: peptidoglycan DD-metalloendopeptidase family protein, partial [Halobacteriovoraceae bacterium]|nr:peptidoglycan DD-metalloendopeptidase family protein [Halobacteriovoraceae bacterium]
MDKHYTVMIVPEKEKGVRSFKVPGIFVRSLAFVIVLCSILFGILIYDYWKILQQISENKHLSLENRQLKEQIQLFQMKVNSLGDDLQRIKTFENKLRIITGLEDITKSEQIVPTTEDKKEMMMDDHGSKSIRESIPAQDSVKLEDDYLKKLLNIEHQPEFVELKRLYDQKIAANLGLTQKYKITKKFSALIKKSFELADDYALFDYKFKVIKGLTSNLEMNVHQLDEYLLNKESILHSTPTKLPTNGWITSYFGHRMSPTAGVRKMHEGLDVGAKYGTPIIAPADGVVTYAGKKSGFGLFVQIDHGYGIETIYAHSQKIIIKNGQKVKRGDLIAKVGSSGYSTGPHL